MFSSKFLLLQYLFSILLELLLRHAILTRRVSFTLNQVILSRGDLATSGNIFGRQKWRWEGPAGVLLVF